MKIDGVSIVDALQLREVARRFYPPTWTASRREAKRLQRRWLAAWRRAPGARVQIGITCALETRKNWQRRLHSRHQHRAHPMTASEFLRKARSIVVGEQHNGSRNVATRT